MLKDNRSSIEELTATTPKKKAALIRSLLPTIEAALRSGQTLKDIWATLDKHSLNTGYHVFQMTLWRTKRSKAGTAPGDWGCTTRQTWVYGNRTLATPLLISNGWKQTDLGFTGAQRPEGTRRQEERRNRMMKSNANVSNATIIHMSLHDHGNH